MHEDRRCATCANWAAMKRSSSDDDAMTGQCHRYAPRPSLSGDRRGVPVIWPITGADDFCGEWYFGHYVSAGTAEEPETE